MKRSDELIAALPSDVRERFHQGIYRLSDWQQYLSPILRAQLEEAELLTGADRAVTLTPID
jgi:hypothetical protein